jgi:hypothetical protein
MSSLLRFFVFVLSALKAVVTFKLYMVDHSRHFFHVEFMRQRMRFTLTFSVMMVFF